MLRCAHAGYGGYSLSIRGGRTFVVHPVHTYFPNGDIVKDSENSQISNHGGKMLLPTL